ncbi:hypothetical protein N8D74_07790 [Curtobacterium flaccumfaciens]|uniref:Uncharacterized protein n=1 Tax=Curtobacterium poinsettiae TaxID=159612 RepID=A0A9Q9PAR9_9MICO|nr:hypothetical protein [Curtobacterium flaccumfaciens]UXN26768.1 hypothetical protein N8D74_07790 [Curtobacterium flaccumfaciens]UYC81611.1 hypothetical protein OE229_03880 [Curtobacterium flaccumfaciens pv. poinsettiae]
MWRSSIDEVQRRPRGWWLLGLAFCFLVFLEVFVAIGSLPGMVVAQLEQYTPCASDTTLQCSYAVGETAQFLVPVLALVVAITTWVIGGSGAPTVRRRMLIPTIGLVVIVLIFVLGVVAINLSIR